MKQLWIFLLLLLWNSNSLMKAQTIYGKVENKAAQPIEGVAVVLQTTDSVYVDAVVTDSLGVFRLNRPQVGEGYRLLFQHLLYKPSMKEVASTDAGVIVLEDQAYALEEVTVQGSRPQVKVEGGKLIYDVPRMLNNRTATNAYEVIKELPGVTESTQDNRLQLAGAGTLNVVINGQLTTLSAEQLQQMLQNLPASRIKEIEVMYNAPLKYNVKGALINIMLSQAESDSWQGETGLDYRQRHYAGGKAHGNLLYASRGLTVDLLMNGTKGRQFNGETLSAIHTLDQSRTSIEQSRKERRSYNTGTFRMGLDYAFPNDDRLSAVYYLEGERATNRSEAGTTFTPLTSGLPAAFNQSTTQLKDHSALHNLHLQYDGHQGISSGIDYTHYTNPGEQHYLDHRADSTLTDLWNPTKQRVDRLSLFANQTVSAGDGYQLNYGLTGDFASSFNRIDYQYKVGERPDQTEITRQKEYTAAVFAEVSKAFGDRFSATLALKGEYYRADYDLNGSGSTLWNEWTLFPTLSLDYTLSPRHIFQFNISSDKTYPSYWATSAQNAPLNSYSYIVGNPQLKPYRSYSGQFLYLFQQKYMLVLFADYEPDYFIQMSYQSEAEMKNIYRFDNIDFGLQSGMQLVVPFSAGKVWNGNLTLTGFYVQQKADHYYEISFNRKTLVGQCSLKNSFNLASSPNIKLTVDAYYVTPGMVQGLFDMGRMWNLDVGLKWSSKNERTTLVLKVSDLFRSSLPELHVHSGSQQSRMQLINDNRSFVIAFTWKFGGYKAKEYDSVDKSRFGR